MTKKYIVTVKSEILGDSEKIMDMREIANFNLCALNLAKICSITGKTESDGMWSVRQAPE